MIKALLSAGSLTARAARLLILIAAAVLIAGSLATSLARPAPRSGPVEEVEHVKPDRPSLVVLDESVAPSSASGSLTVVPALVWSARGGHWVEPAAATEYRAGEQVSVLLRISGLSSGRAYRLTLSHVTCGTARAYALSSPAPLPADPAPRLAPPGPGRLRPDATFPLSSAAAEPGAQVLAWGATPSAFPLPAGHPPCAGEPVVLDVVAHAHTAWLIFAARLAPAATGQARPGIAPLSVTAEPLF